MDSDTESDLVTILLNSKTKIWEDKKRLGLLGERNNYEDLVSRPMHVKHGGGPGGREEYYFHEDVREKEKELLISRIVLDDPGFGENQETRRIPQSLTFLPDDLRSCKKDEFIYKLTNTEGLSSLGEKDNTSDEVEPMVRFGEYSPQNPGLLSPGKTLLGLGEYEEKRRQILERKKREYLEQMAHARQAVKDTVTGRFVESNQHQQESPDFRTRPFIITKCNAGAQTDLQITGYVDDAYSGGVSPVVAATQTPGGEIPVLPSISTYPLHITTVSTQTAGGNIRLPKYETVPVMDAGITVLPQPTSYMPLSPRERKLAEFRESYSPSFLQGRPVRPGGFDMTMDQTPDIRRRREAYQEELRKQIEEKKRIDAEQQRKEEQVEAAIAHRAELQRERMRQEYIREEALRREKQIQRMRQAEEFQRRQEALKLEAELEREAEARHKLEKRLQELEAGLAQHSSYSTQSLGVSLPVPALRAKFSLPDNAKTSSSSGHSASLQDTPENTTSDSKAENGASDVQQQSNDATEKLLQENSTELQPRNKSVHPTRLVTNTKQSSQTNVVGYPPLYTGVSQFARTGCSAAREVRDPVTRETNELVTRGMREPVTRETNELVTRGMREPVTRETNELVTRGIREPVTRETNELVTRGMREPVTRETNELVTRGMREPVTRETNELVTRGMREPVTRETNELVTRGMRELVTRETNELVTRGMREPVTRETNELDTRQMSEPVTISYHRPPTAVMKAAGYNSSYSDSLNETGTRRPEILTHVVQHVPSQGANKKLDDSLPIPILRAPSPVIPTVRIGQANTGSEAMRNVEAKWQVPAVEKNVVHTNANPNNILTQLGAVRHQLQREQMRMEQHLQQRLKNES